MFLYLGGNPSSKSNKGEKRSSEKNHKSLQLMIEDSNSQSVAKSLNLSSTTLILFDEACDSMISGMIERKNGIKT